MTSRKAIEHKTLEWRLTEGGRWQAIDMVDEFDRLAAVARRLAHENREHLKVSCAHCARVRRGLRVSGNRAQASGTQTIERLAKTDGDQIRK